MKKSHVFYRTRRFIAAFTEDHLVSEGKDDYLPFEISKPELSASRTQMIFEHNFAIYVDIISMFFDVKVYRAALKLQQVLTNILNYCLRWNTKIYKDKTQANLFSKRPKSSECPSREETRYIRM